MSQDRRTAEQEQLNAAISDSVQERGRARAQAMKALGSALDSPPSALVEMFKTSGIEIRRVRDGDDAYRMRFSQVVDEAVERFGERVVEVEYAVGATLDPKHPFTSSRGRDLSR